MNLAPYQYQPPFTNPPYPRVDGRMVQLRDRPQEHIQEHIDIAVANIGHAYTVLECSRFREKRRQVDYILPAMLADLDYLLCLLEDSDSPEAHGRVA